MKNLNEAIEQLKTAIKQDYVKWSTSNGTKPLSNYSQEVVNNFDSTTRVTEGKKYIKILTNNGGSAWAFVVNTDDDKLFKKGDLLKCAGWSAPARNAARGNVLEGNYEIAWTGPVYLR